MTQPNPKHSLNTFGIHTRMKSALSVLLLGSFASLIHAFNNPSSTSTFYDFEFPLGTITTKQGPLPITLVFESTLHSGLLGAGWLIPLIDSRLVLESEHIAECLLPSGEQIKIPCYPSPLKIKSDFYYACVVKGSSEAQIFCPDGTIYKYHLGLISQIISQNGEQIRISRSENEISLSVDSVRALLVKNDPSKVQVEMSCGDSNYTFYLNEKMPQFGAGTSPAILALIPALSEVQYNGQSAFICEVAKNGITVQDLVLAIRYEGTHRSIPLSPNAKRYSPEYPMTSGKKFTFFSSGNLSGRLRSIEEQEAGSIRRFKMIYDENGKLIRGFGDGVSLTKDKDGFNLIQTGDKGSDRVTKYFLTSNGTFAVKDTE